MKLFNKFKKLQSLIFVGTIVVFSMLFISFDDTDDFDLAKNLDIYQTLIRELRLYYVDDIQSAKIIQTSIEQMLESLDPYTVFYPESKIEDFKFMTTGQYGGIGALIRKDRGNIIIEQVYKNYPAEKAGIRPGDVIKKVENKIIDNKNTDDISEMLKGVPNTDVVLSIYRPFTKENLNITVTRQKIQVKNVPYFGMINSETGYIKLTGFTQSAYEEVKQALVNLKEKNATQIIFDLRSNPGGLLNEAVKIVGLFVDKGTEVVSTRGKMQQWNQTLETPRQPVDTEMDIVVLVNSNSASASEIVSGALQDLDRAVIVGQRTYGKGLVQTTRDLSYNAKLKITTAKYYIPSGRCIQALDYTHRNPDGSVGHVPDSIITEFKTKNGRSVYDGGGILPDIKVELQKIDPLSKYLMKNYIIFDYANIYRFLNDKISTAANYSITDKEYNDFISYVVERNVNYETETDKALTEFINTAKNEKYYDKLSSDIKLLEDDLSHNVKDDLILFKDDIKEMLNRSIVVRYYYESGLIQYAINNDPEVKKGLELLSNDTKYRNILMN